MELMSEMGGRSPGQPNVAVPAWAGAWDEGAIGRESGLAAISTMATVATAPIAVAQVPLPCQLPEPTALPERTAGEIRPYV